MKRQTSLAVTLSLLLCACTRSDPPDVIHVKPTADLGAKAAAAQARVASAFYETIVPKLGQCWNSVQGDGEILFKYTYRNQGDNWVWQKHELAGSSLPQTANDAAMQCMEDAARGSTFPLEAGEIARRGTEFEITWGWPVPLPQDTSQLARMIDPNPGNPPECRKSCKDCGYFKETGKSDCVDACSGWTGCVPDGTGTGCQMKRPECATGWSGNWVGTAIAGNAPAHGTRRASSGH